VIADRCGVVVDQVYGDLEQYEGRACCWPPVLFAVQIYCDFSGYTDIALGAARVMGFDLMVNFRTPVPQQQHQRVLGPLAHQPQQSWFRDYLYIPLGGNRVVKWRWY
jgi:alginate O-acetyltransferase complex protein AlgI